MATIAEPQPQHLRALALANAAKRAGEALRDDLAAGRVTLAAALEDGRAAPMTVPCLLKAQPRWGRSRSTRLCHRLGIPESKRVRDLTERQRAAIVTAV